MNSQLKEVLAFQGKKVPMACEPLNQYFSRMNSPLRFFSKFKNNERGYLGKWAIIENELHLIEFIGVLENKREMFLEDLFPGKETVFAEWFDGEIILNQGRLLALKSKFSPAVYERDLHLEIVKGCLINTYSVENVAEKISSFKDNYWADSKVNLAAF